MTRTLAIVSALGLVLHGQLKEPSGTASIAGRVIDAASGQAVAGASVTLYQRNFGQSSATTRSDSGGRFAFQGLSTEPLSVGASHIDYVAGAFGQRRPRGEPVTITLHPGERRDDLAILMFRSASISGRITNERGEPVVNASVHAWPRHSGNARYLPSGTTDKTGTYRIWNLTPDEYVVAVPAHRRTLLQRAPEPSSGCTPPPPPGYVPPPPERPVGTLYTERPRGIPPSRPTDDGKPRTYATTYFPGVLDGLAADTVSIGIGEARSGVDFSLTPVQSTTVTGQLTSPRGIEFGADVRLRLRGHPNEDEDFAEVSTFTADGAFTLLDVPVGSYLLEVSRHAAKAGCDYVIFDQESKATRIEIEVTPRGIDRLVVPLATGATVSGVVRHSGLSNRSEFWLHLLLVEGTSNAPSPPVERRGDRFTASGIVPGTYELQAFDNGRVDTWWLESMTLGGRDVTGRPVEITANGLDGLVLTMSDRPTGLSGTVTTFTGAGVADATAVLFPIDRARWNRAAAGSLAFQTSRALRGAYKFTNVPAGDYFISAVDESTMDAWPSEKFLAHIAARAQRVTVVSGVTQTLSLTLR